jgi:hypothetical protein
MTPEMRLKKAHVRLMNHPETMQADSSVSFVRTHS